MTYTDDEFKTYLKVKRALLMEDVRNYVRDYLENENDREIGIDDITEEQFEQIDFDYLVEQFEERTEYFDPTADVWENIVSNYFSNYFEDYEF